MSLVEHLCKFCGEWLPCYEIVVRVWGEKPDWAPPGTTWASLFTVCEGCAVDENLPTVNAFRKQGDLPPLTSWPQRATTT